MDFFDFLFLIVFILIIAANIAKQLKKTPKPTGRQAAPVKTGWRKALDDVLKEIREQMEKGVEPVAGKPTRGRLSWEDIILPESENKEFPVKETEPQKTVKARPMPTPIDADVVEMRTLAPEKKTSAMRMEEILLKKTRSGVMSTAAGQPDMGMMPEPEGRWSVEDLRNAMIWHEILAPPLGLRDDLR
jgi:hypothetical protein